MVGDTPRFISVMVTGDTLSVDLEDGRTISVPIGWYPRLARGTQAERVNFEITGAGYGIHWPELDEDIGVEGLLLGRKSTESPASFERWLERPRNPLASQFGQAPSGMLYSLSTPESGILDETKRERRTAMAEYRKRKGSDTWHWCRNCSLWPTSNYDTSQTKPGSGELCNQCKAKDAAGECKK